MKESSDIFERFGFSRVINAAGTATRLGASPIDPEVLAAMTIAAQCCVDMGQLQGRASEVIAQCTGAQAGIVTSGATAALLVGAAACMTGFDLVKMGALPDTSGMRNEFIISRSHRNSYDHGVRAAGAKLVEVGLPDRLTGCGVRDTDAWEFEGAFNDRTAGILYLARADARPDLKDVVRVAHKANLPVLVDAAAELPPASNLRRFIDEGADLVAFSGGKSIGGPSASGILCGQRSLVGAALLQQLDLDYVFEDWQPPAQLIDKKSLRGIPRHGIGRGCKVGKEQIIGLLSALVRFTGEDDTSRRDRFGAIVQSLAAALKSLPGLRIQATADAGHGAMPLLEVRVLAGSGGPDARTIAARLRAATPKIYVEDIDADVGTLMLVPTSLADGDVALIAAAFASAVKPG